MPNIYDDEYRKHRDILAGAFKAYSFPKHSGAKETFPESWSVALIDIAQREIQRREDFIKARRPDPRYYDHCDAGHIPPAALVSWEHQKAVLDAVLALGVPPTFMVEDEEVAYFQDPPNWAAPEPPDEPILELEKPLYAIRLLHEKLLPALKALRTKAGPQKYVVGGARDRVLLVQQSGKLTLAMMSETVLVTEEIPCIVTTLDDADERYELGMVDVRSLVDWLSTYPATTQFNIERISDFLRISEHRAEKHAAIARFKLPERGAPLGYLPERLAMDGVASIPLYEIADKKDMAYLDSAADVDGLRPVLTWGYVTTVHDNSKWAITADGHRLHGVRLSAEAPLGAFIKMKRSIFHEEGKPGTYPELSAIVPRESACLFVWDFDTETFLSVMKRAKAYAKDSANSVKLTFRQDDATVTVSAKSAERGDFEFVFENQVFRWAARFSQYEVAANVNYLIKAVRPKTSYRLGFQTPPSPLLFSAVDESHFAIVMPMSLTR